MDYPKKLLSRDLGNTKIRKTQESAKDDPRFQDVLLANMSLLPNTTICPSCQIAGCLHLCLKDSGRQFPTISKARQKKTDYFLNHRDDFLNQLRNELDLFQIHCARKNKRPFVRLNTLSDIQWERTGIPQTFQDINFIDYTKLAKRIGRVPYNYKLIFSYSKAPAYQKQVDIALQTDAPIAVVFDKIPTDPSYRFLGRRVIDGDKSDLVNMYSGPVIVGLKYKRTKADKATVINSDFVINTNLIATA